tara:strand:- start:42 stop:314 length:273 start_codon:yes stop_codon:yes gene_type:complete
VNPFDVGTGPVAFERKYQAVPQPPSPQLAGTRLGVTITPSMVGFGATVMLSVVALTIVKGKKVDRMKHAKMLAGASFLAFTAIGAAKKLS